MTLWRWVIWACLGKSAADLQHLRLPAAEGPGRNPQKRTEPLRKAKKHCMLTCKVSWYCLLPAAVPRWQSPAITPANVMSVVGCLDPAESTAGIYVINTARWRWWWGSDWNYFQSATVCGKNPGRVRSRVGDPACWGLTSWRPLHNQLAKWESDGDTWWPGIPLSLSLFNFHFSTVVLPANVHKSLNQYSF